MSLGQVGGGGEGREGVCVAVVTFVGWGGQSGRWRRRLSSPKRPCREAGMHGGPREAQDGGEAAGGRGSVGRGTRPPETGVLKGRGWGQLSYGTDGGQVSTPPLQMRKRGPRGRWGLRGARRQRGDPTSPPPVCPPPCEEAGDFWNRNARWRWRGGQGDGQTDGQESMSRQDPLQKKQLNFQGGSFFFLFRLFVSFKKITRILPLPADWFVQYYTPGVAGGQAGGRAGGRVKDFINNRQVPDLQFVNIS